jgi:hypothetical protein
MASEKEGKPARRVHDWLLFMLKACKCCGGAMRQKAHRKPGLSCVENLSRVDSPPTSQARREIEVRGILLPEAMTVLL